MKLTPGAAQLLRKSRAAARSAGLTYVSCDAPGIRRVRRGKGFVYLTPTGSLLRDAKELSRIRTLAIPPAWTEVWICSSAEGHLQAVGLDARGRKQYRYHPRWRVVRDEAKYHDVLAFAENLPRLRKQLERDLSRPGLSKRKVLATVVGVMERTRIRVGNDRYAQANHSYGLTTLLDQHARIHGSVVEFSFRGKGGKPYRASIRDRRLAGIVRRCRDIPGQRLFQFIDSDSVAHPISSTDVNEYIQEAMGHPFTAKNFRTWAGTLGAALLLNECAPCKSDRHARRTIVQVVARVAEQLGNTAAICRKSYVHPAVLTAYSDGKLHAAWSRCLQVARRRARPGGLSTQELAVLALFQELAEVRGRAA